MWSGKAKATNKEVTPNSNRAKCACNNEKLLREAGNSGNQFGSDLKVDLVFTFDIGYAGSPITVY